MKDYAELIKTLRRYAKVLENASRGVFRANEAQVFASAADAIDELLHIHQLDLSELVRLRRQLQALEESEAQT